MAERRPLVLLDGSPVQLPTGDTTAGGVGDISSAVVDWDFLSGQTTGGIWVGGAISGGTVVGSTVAVTDTDHPGVVRFGSGAGANSGYRFTSSTGAAQAFVLKPGIKFNAIVRVLGASDSRAYIGFLNSSTITAPTNAAMFFLSATSLSYTCANSGTEANGSIATLSANTWYNFEIEALSSSSVIFRVYDSAGDLLHSQTVSSNVPTGGLGCGVTAWTVSASVDLLNLDYLRLLIPGLQRG